MKGWYLVFCKPRQEDKASFHLQRQGYSLYLPKLLTTSRSKKKEKQIVTPLFPRYLFIELDRLHDNWGPIRSTYGVSGLVKFGNEAARVPASLLVTLRERENEDGLHELGKATLRPGARVRVIAGPMNNLDAIFLSYTGTDRVVVLMNILGKSSRVQIPKHCIEADTSAPKK